MTTGRSLANAKKRRGVARASVTRLTNRLEDEDGTAQLMSQKLSDSDTEFQTHHHAVVDLIDEEEVLAKEQEVLDAHHDLTTEQVIS